MTALVGTIAVAPRWQAGQVYVSKGYYTLGGAIVSGDTITWTGLLPANDVQIINVARYGQEFDTNASPTGTEIWGDGTTTNGYITSKTAGSANAQLRFDGDGALIGVSTEASANVVCTVGGSLATAASSGTVWVEATYLCTNAQAITA